MFHFRTQQRSCEISVSTAPRGLSVAGFLVDHHHLRPRSAQATRSPVVADFVAEVAGWRGGSASAFCRAHALTA